MSTVGLYLSIPTLREMVDYISLFIGWIVCALGAWPAHLWVCNLVPSIYHRIITTTEPRRLNLLGKSNSCHLALGSVAYI